MLWLQRRSEQLYEMDKELFRKLASKIGITAVKVLR